MRSMVGRISALTTRSRIARRLAENILCSETAGAGILWCRGASSWCVHPGRPLCAGQRAVLAELAPGVESQATEPAWRAFLGLPERRFNEPWRAAICGWTNEIDGGVRRGRLTMNSDPVSKFTRSCVKRPGTVPGHNARVKPSLTGHVVELERGVHHERRQHVLERTVLPVSSSRMS
jgi:hypothetical protein